VTLTGLAPLLNQFRIPLPRVRLSTDTLDYVLIFCFALINLQYISSSQALNLAPDEAHYWLWSQNLDWSYYSKGPLVAWLIRVSCELFGNSEFAVRFPAVVSGTLTLLAMRQLFRIQGNINSTLGILALLCIPATAASSVLMTIDAPFLCCWAWASVFIWKSFKHESKLSWIVAGGVTALGILAKYTMLLLPGCLLLLVLANQRHMLASRGLWLYLTISALGMLPILMWNLQHEGVGAQHLLSLAKVDRDNHWTLLGPVQFLFGQMAFLQIIWFPLWALATVRNVPKLGSTDQTAFFWYLSVPVVGLFFLASLRGNGPLNWAAPAYITGLPLALGYLTRLLNSPSRKTLLFSVICCSALGFGLSCASRYPTMVRPLLSQFVASASEEKPTPLRGIDPTCRLSGWTTLAKELDRQRSIYLLNQGEEPLLAAMTWTIPGEVSFYCSGHPQVYSFGLMTSDRHSQFDLWRPNPVADAQVFRGCSFLYVGELNLNILQAFERVSPPVEVLASDGGIPVAKWKIYLLEGFRGFPVTSSTNTPSRY
jgi:hypothetical protein